MRPGAVFRARCVAAMIVAIVAFASIGGAQPSSVIGAGAPLFYLQASGRGERTPVSDPASLPGYGRRISLNLDGATRNAALARIGQLSRINFVYASDLVAGGEVRLVGDTFTVHSALVAVLMNASVDVLVQPDGSAVLVRRVSRAVAQASRISGTVRDTSSGSTLAGTVVSVLDSDGVSVARVNTNAVGQYSTPLPASGAQLRVVRLGYQPQTTRLDGRAIVDIGMRRLPTLLSSVTVNDDRTCSTNGDRAAALSLWEQARAALLTSIVARETQPATAAIYRYDRVLDVKDNRVLQQTAHSETGTTTRPFKAYDPRDLATNGYLETRPSGARLFKSPDADVLLDPRFALSHCFSVRPADSEHPGQVGLSFEPSVARDSVVDVWGTLWFEPSVPALRSLAFHLPNPNGVLANDKPEGVLYFRTMPNGVVFIDEWKMRIPLLAELRVQATSNGNSMAAGGARLPAATSAQQAEIVQMAESGGMVLSASWQDGLHFETELAPLAGIVTEERSTKPLPGVLVLLAGTADTVLTDSIGRFTIFPVLPGRYTMHAVDTTLSYFVRARETGREVDIVSGAPSSQRFSLPGRATSVGQVCTGVEQSDRTFVLIGTVVDPVSGSAPPIVRMHDDLYVQTAKKERYRLRDLTITGAWVADGMMIARSGFSANIETQKVTLDERGRFTICGVPKGGGKSIKLTATRDGASTDLTVPLDSPGDFVSIRWALDIASLGTHTIE